MSNYANRYWEVGEKNKFGKEAYLLHFTEFMEDEVIIGFVQDENDETAFCYTSKFIDVEYDFFNADDIEDAKEICITIINEFLEEKISSIEETMKKFNEKTLED